MTEQATQESNQAELKISKIRSLLILFTHKSIPFLIGRNTLANFLQPGSADQMWKIIAII